MSLKTKSIQSGGEANDGIRICVMRRFGKNLNFDIWMPVLAPSNELLNDYIAKKINWNDYLKRFKEEVLVKNKEYIEILANLAIKRDVTILCWEKKPDYCHRRLLAEECEKIRDNLKIFLK